MSLLVRHPDVFDTCLRILRDRGYTLEVHGRVAGDLRHPLDVQWSACKDGVRLIYRHARLLRDASSPDDR